MNNISSLDHIAINVSNIENSIEWYTRELNASIIYRDKTWCLLSIANTKIALTIKDEHPPHVGFLIKEFSKNHIDKVKKHRDNTEYVYISDIDGNIIELIKR